MGKHSTKFQYPYIQKTEKMIKYHGRCMCRGKVLRTDGYDTEKEAYEAIIKLKRTFLDNHYLKKTVSNDLRLYHYLGYIIAHANKLSKEEKEQLIKALS